ncbi:MAG: hypothetical protein PHX53_18335 [Syntrophales bacterium]|nr:hypothetical protein [Syntrophales bacterium]
MTGAVGAGFKPTPTVPAFLPNNRDKTMNPLTPGEETMIAALALQVKDGDRAACGTLSPMPAAALWLAQLTHAPKAEVFIAGSKDWPFAGEWQGFFDFAQQGKLHLFYLSGAQIDGQGNINLMAVGDYPRPRVRLPGGAGSAILAYVVERVVLFKTVHEPRGLVPQVDVVTAPGYTPQLSPRQRPGQVTCLVTPKCVFKFAPPAPARLASLHPGEGWWIGLTSWEHLKLIPKFRLIYVWPWKHMRPRWRRIVCVKRAGRTNRLGFSISSGPVHICPPTW